jgi:hypothetical protein
MNDDDEEEEYEVYEFVTTGEKTCERCMALAGSQWREPPDPPHAHCECEVVVKMAGRHAPRDCGDTTWSMEAIPGGESTVHYGPGGLGRSEERRVGTLCCRQGR